MFKKFKISLKQKTFLFLKVFIITKFQFNYSSSRSNIPSSPKNIVSPRKKIPILKVLVKNLTLKYPFFLPLPKLQKPLKLRKHIEIFLP